MIWAFVDMNFSSLLDLVGMLGWVWYSYLFTVEIVEASKTKLSIVKTTYDIKQSSKLCLPDNNLEKLLIKLKFLIPYLSSGSALVDNMLAASLPKEDDLLICWFQLRSQRGSQVQRTIQILRTGVKGQWLSNIHSDPISKFRGSWWSLAYLSISFTYILISYQAQSYKAQEGGKGLRLHPRNKFSKQSNVQQWMFFIIISKLTVSKLRMTPQNLKGPQKSTWMVRLPPPFHLLRYFEPGCLKVHNIFVLKNLSCVYVCTPQPKCMFACLHILSNNLCKTVTYLICRNLCTENFSHRLILAHLETWKFLRIKSKRLQKIFPIIWQKRRFSIDEFQHPFESFGMD